MKIFLLIPLLFFTYECFSQSSISEASLETTALAGSGNNLPFWFSQNQLGKYSTNSNWQELTEGKLFGVTDLGKKINLTYGADLGFLGTENSTRTKIIQAYAGLAGKIINLRIGAFADDEILGGLSPGNGNIVRSLNYRPYPMIRLSTSGFVPFLFAKNWFRFKAEYDEGLLRDDRIVHHPHLHHKSLDLQFLPGKTFRFSVGVNHYVFWGGTLPDGRKLPDDLSSYFRYILGKKGSSEFLETDQLNVAGNQLGAYLVAAEKDFKTFQVQVRISHPFEDHSGMEMTNRKDNLYSFYIRKKKEGSLFDEFLFEYLYTKNQSGDPAIEGTSHAKDNYFNHGVYKTGFSYRGYSMGTPLFFPLIKNSEGTAAGFENNRISAFHAGAKGYLTAQICWKAMLTYSRNFGIYDHPYDPVHKQVYSLAELNWKSKTLPLAVGARLAADFYNQADNQFGAGFSFKWWLR